MSYDLTVYAPRAAAEGQIEQIISSIPTLLAVASSQGLSVQRGTRGRYCFTIGGPFRVEAEDVPTEITAVVLGASHMYQVLVEGSADADIPYAVRFTRRLAQALGGALQDQQTDEIWSRGASRIAQKPPRDQRIDTVDYRWYALRDSLPVDATARYLELCRRYLPEALPRRFGEFEPLQHKLADNGDAGFVASWQAATSLMFFSCSSPCIRGSMYAGPSEAHPQKAWLMSLIAHREHLADPTWRKAFRQLFLGLAEEFNCFYASAEVTRGLIWNGRSTGADGQTEWPIMPARREGWMGLPPYPVWWSYYGDPYRELVSNHFDDGLTITTSGLFHSWTETPSDRDTLAQAATQAHRPGPGHPGIPGNLLSHLVANDRRMQPAPIAPAEHIPDALK